MEGGGERDTSDTENMHTGTVTHTSALTHYPNWKIGQPVERPIEASLL